MKTLKISNGETRIGYEFTELSEVIQEKIIEAQIEFEVEIMDENSPYYHLAVEMEKNYTPWFLGSAIYNYDREGIIENIKANDYLFDIDGEMLPVTYHTADNKVVKITFGKHEYLTELV